MDVPEKKYLMSKGAVTETQSNMGQQSQILQINVHVHAYCTCTLRGRIKGTASALSVIQHGLHEACTIQHGT